MTRLYDNSGIWRRTVAYAAVTVAAFFWGIWELWAAAHGASDPSTGSLFGVLFIGGAGYSAYQVYFDWRDMVTALDLDEAAGALTATIWSPTGPLRLSAPIGEFRDWRSHVKVVSRQARTFFLYAELTGRPRPLRLELTAKSDLSGLRRIAPDAVADFEAAAGLVAADKPNLS